MNPCFAHISRMRKDLTFQTVQRAFCGGSSDSRVDHVHGNVIPNGTDFLSEQIPIDCFVVKTTAESTVSNAISKYYNIDRAFFLQFLSI